MLLAQAPDTAILLALAAIFLLIALLSLIVLASVGRPWLRGYLSGTAVSVFDILGMRLRRTNVDAVLAALIMAKQAGVALSCRQMEAAYLQGVDLERVTLAMIQARRQSMDITFDELVAADLDHRLAEKLKGRG